MTISQDELKQAATILQSGRLVAFPTETVYGLGGNALSDDAVSRIYAAKERPQFNPLIVHVASVTMAGKYADLDKKAIQLAGVFWPGPLTLVLNRTKGCELSLLVSAGLDTVAIRIPAHPTARALLDMVKLPIAAPSANRSGRVSPTEAAHVKAELEGVVEMILDGGRCTVGLESTVVDMTEKTPVILRPGSITQEMIEDIIGEVDIATADSPIKSPGMLERHYAPAAQLRLNAKKVEPGEALLAFGKPLEGAILEENLSPAKNLQEAAANLFRMLRKLDETGIASIAVMPIPEKGLGVAINDRLQRAAK